MSVPAIEVVERAKEKGLDISDKYVHTTRSLMRTAKVAAKKAAEKKTAKKPATAAGKRAAKKKVAKKPAKKKVTVKKLAKSPLVDEDFFIPAVAEVEQRALELDLRELVFRLGLGPVKKLVNKFEKQLEAGRLFQD